MLFNKMMRDVRLHFGQFASIFLLSFLAAFLYTGVAGEVAGVAHARDAYHEQTNLADAWIYGENFSDEQLQKLAQIDGINEVQSRQYLQSTDSGNNTLYLYFQDENIISMPMVLEGEAYLPDAEGSEQKIWIAKRFADEQQISIGETYTVSVNNEMQSYTVAGFVWSPEYEYYKDEVDLEPDYHTTGYAFLSCAALDTKESNQIVFTVEETGSAVTELEPQIQEILGDSYSVLLDRSGITNLTTVDNEIEQHRMMSILFSAFFVVIAMLTTVTTMKRIVDRQRVQIGTLKALGMKKSKIYLHYLSYGFFPSLVGAAIGTAIGPLTITPLLFRMKYYLDSSDEYMLPKFSLVYPMYFWLLTLGLVALCTVSAWLSCKNILRLTPAVALRPAQPRSGKRTIFEKLPFWNKLKFSVRYNLRDIARNKGRTIFGLCGTISCMGLMLCGFCAKDNFRNAVTDLYMNGLMNNSTMITLNLDIPIEEAESIRDEVNGELIMSSTTEIRIPGSSEKISGHMNVYEDGQIANILDENLQVGKISGSDFTITYKTAKQLGISEGDTVEWHIYGSNQWITSTVTMITRAPFEQGIVTTRQVIEDADYAFTPTRLITQEDVAEDFADTSDYIDSVTSKSNLALMMSNYMDLVNLVMGFMLVLAIILAVIVLYSLGLLSFEERQKEMATLKVLGFSSKNLRRLMMEQNIILAVIGAVLGIPLGQWMQSILISSLGESMDIPTYCRFEFVLISFCITVITSILVNLLFTNRIRKMDMVEEIKAME